VAQGEQSMRGKELLDYRAEFPILAHTTYLINHSLAAMPRQAEERLAEYARMWNERGIRAWGEGWWETPMTVGDQVGRIIGAPSGSTVMHQNVAVAEAVALSCFLPVDPRRNRVVYERGNFPSVRYLYQAQPELEVVVCEDADEIVEAIDERTLLVPISHVLFKTAEIQEVAPIVERAHEVGAHVILDCYQSAGIVPLDVTALGVGFAVGGSVKWLCGGPGNGWLYVRPDLSEGLTPTFTGWQAHERPFGFEEEMEYASGAARFLTGTPNVPAHFAATAGYDLIEEIGVPRIRENSLRQTQLLIDLADEAGFDVRSPREPRRRGGTVTVHVPEFPAVYRELMERQIICDFRPDAGIRLGPHYFTTDDELRHVIEQIGEIVETGAFARHLGTVARH
jgi:kynureninase